MAKNHSLQKRLGVAVPLGALYSKNNKIIGEFEDLIPFAQFCKKSNISLIQLLPVNDSGTQSSPYSALSAFALHPIYISINKIEEFEHLYNSDKNFSKKYDDFTKKHKYCLRYDYQGILNAKQDLLRDLYESTSIYREEKESKELSTWIKNNSWIKTYAVYKKFKWDYMQSSWKNWKKEDAFLPLEQIEKLWSDSTLKKEHLFYAWVQMIADNQFLNAVKKVHAGGILIKGDMPILMNEDSCDAWAYPEFFNQDLRAGSPSDGDNPLGQNWGFPTYNWKKLKENDYSWWKDRLINSSKYYDAYRLDHILGFFRIWAIPSSDVNALNGHAEPCAFIKKDELYKLGFDDDRIRWLSESHIPTHFIEDITWNHENAHKILKLFATQIDDEELWLFKKEIKGSSDFFNIDLSDFCTEETSSKIKQILCDFWSNRTLIPLGKNKFVPLWTFSKSTSWNSLNEVEKEKLLKLFEKNNLANEKLWKKQAEEILNALTSSVKMVPCGEDLGVNIKSVPEVMKKNDILSLKVVRWMRKWEKENQPFIDFNEYDFLSVATTSVHDSSTLRQWWQDEKQSVEQFVLQNNESFGLEDDFEDEELKQIIERDFDEKLAECILFASSSCNSVWFIPPLQDFLFMEKKYWHEKCEEERINVPGTVNEFNWTYRMPISIDELLKDNKLIEKITAISKNRGGN